MRRKLYNTVLWVAKHVGQDLLSIGTLSSNRLAGYLIGALVKGLGRLK